MPKRTVLWAPEAQAELRVIDRETALRILQPLMTIWPVAPAT
jgi:hypothetical protein